MCCMSMYGVMSEPKKIDTRSDIHSDGAAQPTAEELMARLAPDVEVVLSSMPPPPPEAPTDVDDRG